MLLLYKSNNETYKTKFCPFLHLVSFISNGSNGRLVDFFSIFHCRCLAVAYFSPKIWHSCCLVLYFQIISFIAISILRTINFKINVGKTYFPEEMCICIFYFKMKLKTNITIGHFSMKTEIRVVLSCLANLKVLLSILNSTG